jgi:ubiquinone biosynthesis protein COQ9
VSVFRSPERDAALEGLLAASLGAETWRLASLREVVDPDADLLFPGGPVEMIEAYFDLGDRRVAASGAAAGVEGVSARVRALVLERVAFDRANLPATRRAVAILALPGHAAAGTRSLARTSDAIWRAAGDRSADFSWYTRRATLAAVHAATMLYALGEDGSGAERAPDDVAAFLDRRLARLAALGRRRRGAVARA